jgi:hypothetical protein
MMTSIAVALVRTYRQNGCIQCQKRNFTLSVANLWLLSTSL